MSVIRLPYGKGSVALETGALGDVCLLESRLASARGALPPEELVRNALHAPAGSEPLCQLARGKKEIVVISSDHTRPVPSKILLPALLAEIRRGNPGANVTILVATGCHRAPTQDELREKYGEDILQNEAVVAHDCDAPDLAELGRLPSGNLLVLNALAAKADLLVAEGFIEPHFFAGYSGGRKSVMPGICGRNTVLRNHCASAIAHPCSKTGVLEGNVIHRDMVAGARAAKLAFVLNVVLNGEKEIVGAFAGSAEAAHAQGVAFIEGLCKMPACAADIVVATNGGHPLDQNIYQSVKGMCTAAAACKAGGVIVMAARCEDGHGGEAFFRFLASSSNPAALLREISRRGDDETQPDQWQAQIFLQIVLRHRVILVSDAPREMVEAMHLEWAPNVDTAMDMALEAAGAGSRIAVIPDGVSTIVGVEEE